MIPVCSSISLANHVFQSLHLTLKMVCISTNRNFKGLLSLKLFNFQGAFLAPLSECFSIISTFIPFVKNFFSKIFDNFTGFYFGFLFIKSVLPFISFCACNFGYLCYTIFIIYAPVAQLDRAIASDAMCRWFESSRARHTIII